VSNEVIDRIHSLRRDQALEAARFVAKSLAGNEPADADAPELKAISEEPYRHLPDVEVLARLVLLSAAATPEGATQVEQAIAGAQRKQFILGGAEIVMLAALAVVALKIVVTKGKGKTTQRIKIRMVGGKPVVEIEEIQESISISKDLAAILRPHLGGDSSSEDE
jgi:hypothetical protein